MTRRMPFRLIDGGKFANMARLARDARRLARCPDGGRRGWLSIHRKADGRPWRGMELALRYRGDAFRVVYALQIGADIGVVHTFQKKPKSGIATPRQDIDLVKDRLKRLKEALG